MLMHLHVILFLMWFWISNTQYNLCLCGLHLHLFMLVGVVTLLHYVRETLLYSMSSWYHHAILHFDLIVVPQWQRLSTSMMKRNLFGRFSRISDGVHKFGICSMYVWFWSQSTCYSLIMRCWSFKLCVFKGKMRCPLPLA